jgi:hypothetical protein
MRQEYCSKDSQTNFTSYGMKFAFIKEQYRFYCLKS